MMNTPALSLCFRPAQASDADACGPLIFAAGTDESQFFLDEPAERCIAFFRVAFTSNRGLYSWRHHYVAYAPDGTILSQMATYHSRDIYINNFQMVWAVSRFFGPLKMPGILSRGMVLEHEMPPPKRGQIIIRQVATDECVRSQGICTAMFAHALADGWLQDSNQYLLDVRLDNPRARAFYERLGFVAQPRQHPPHARLPAGLVSMRMAWSAKGMDALRAQARSTLEA